MTTTKPTIKPGDTVKGKINQVHAPFVYIHVPELEAYSVAIQMTEYSSMKSMRRQTLRFNTIHRANVPVEVQVLRIDDERKLVDVTYSFPALIHDFVTARDVLRAQNM